ncbi:MAG: hypothetical protein ABIF01_01715, partial [Candidatus Micrarchaeota archaeon]
VLVARVPAPKFFHTDETHISKLDLPDLERLARKSGFRKAKAYVYHYPFPFEKWREEPYKSLNYVRGLPLVREIFDYSAGLKGLPAYELVLVAMK